MSGTATARATVLIPTFGDAPFLRWAVASVQAQTLREIEIQVVFDGSPPHMVDMVAAMAEKDPRVAFRVFPKGPRTGEPHRHQVLAETGGEIVCYLSHDDLLLPWHVETMEDALRLHDFAHSLHLDVETGVHGARKEAAVRQVLVADLREPGFRQMMLDPARNRNYFGLTFGAHTRAAYRRLPEGWTTAPDGLATDLHMWRKFLREPWCRCESVMEVTALHFEKPFWRRHWSPERREFESSWWFFLSQEPGFREHLTSLALRRVALDALHREQTRGEESAG